MVSTQLGSSSSGRQRRRVLPLLTGVLAAAVVAATAVRITAAPSTTPTLEWLFNAPVNATTRVGDTLFVAGDFSKIVPPSGRVGRFATLSTTTGAVVTTYPRFDAALTASTPDATGAYYAVVDTDVNGTLAHDIVRVRPDGTKDPAFTFGATVKVDGYPRMTVVGTRLIAVQGLQVGGVDRLMVAVDRVTGALDGWVPSLPLTTYIMATSVSATKFFVLSYLNAGGRDLRAFDIATGAVAWQITLAGQSSLVPAGTIQLSGNRVMVGIDRLYAVDQDTGAVDPAWGAAIGNVAVRDIAVSGAAVYVAGVSIPSYITPVLVALDLGTGAVLPWQVTPAPGGLSITPSPNGGVFLNGSIIVGGQTLSGPLEIDATGAVTSWSLAIQGLVIDLLPNGELLLARDPIESLIPRAGVAAFDLTTGALSPIGPVLGGLSGQVSRMATDGQRVFFQGTFTSVNGQPRSGLAAIDGTTGALLEWPAPGVTLFLGSADGSWVYGSDGSRVIRVSAATGVVDATWAPTAVGAPAPHGGELWASRGLPARPGAVLGGSVHGVLDPVTGAFSERFRNADAPGRVAVVEGDTVYVLTTVVNPGPGATNLGETVFAYHRTTGVPVSRPPLAGSIRSFLSAGGRLLVAGSRIGLGGELHFGAFEVARPGARTSWTSGFSAHSGFRAPGSTMAWSFGDVLVVAGEIGDLSGGGETWPFTKTVAFPMSGASAPSNLRSSFAGPNTVFSWDPMSPPPAAGYVIEGGFVAGQAAGALAVGSATSVALPMPAGPLFIRVRPQGSTEVSNEIVAGCFAPPLPPTALTTTLVGTMLTLAWAPPAATVTNYTLLAGTAAGLSNVVTLPLGPQTSVSGTVPGGTFFARVTASNACGTSGPSGEVFFTIGAPDPLPAAPTNLAASVSGSTVSLTWTAPAGAVTSYVLEAGTAAGLANLGTLSIGATPSLVIPGVPAGTYVLRVRAVTSAGSGAPSADVVVVVP